MAQSHNIPTFKTAIKKPIEDQTIAYKKSNDNLINAIQNSIDYFKIVLIYFTRPSIVWL